MEVTKKNFEEVLQELDSELEKASFLAIDTEFTGLQDGTASKILSLDMPVERYKKVREGSAKFLVVQFGLSIFQYDNGKYVYKCYNFYTFPSTNTRSGCPETVFLSQASSIAFLASYGFDFNKLFSEGIPYLNLSGEEKMKKVLEEKLSYLDPNKNPVSASVGDNNILTEIPEEQKSFMDEVL